MVSMNWLHGTKGNFLFLVTATPRAVKGVRPVMRIVQIAPKFTLRSSKIAQNRFITVGMINTIGTRPAFAMIGIIEKVNVVATTGT